jgi:hypothetical protein
MEVEEERETRERMIWSLKKNDDYFLQEKKGRTTTYRTR